MELFQGTAQAWNGLVASLPDPHLLQTWEWSRVKAAYGWEPQPWTWVEGGRVLAAAMLLRRRLPVRGMAPRLSVLYAPKGPLLDWGQAGIRARVLDDLQRYARQQGSIFLKIDPDVSLGWGIPGSGDDRAVEDGAIVQRELVVRGWGYSPDQVQYRNTVLIDLRGTEEQLLARMKQKTRYNLRLAGRKGVSVRPGGAQDLQNLYRMYAETATRDGFVIREERYYRTVWETFLRQQEPACEPLVAEVDGVPVAGIFVFRFAGKAYYLYGMSLAAHREKMPNYLLQWEAIRRAKAGGCLSYDLWGAPEVFDERDPLWGVFRFKEGLGGQVRRTLGAWDYAPRPLLYRLYTRVIPRVLDWMRARGQERTRRDLGA